jgi:hypothetical protein
MPVGEYLRALRPAIHGTLVMIAAVSLLKWELFQRGSSLLRLVLEIVTGAIAYSATLLLLHRERVTTFVRSAQSFRRATLSEQQG